MPQWLQILVALASQVPQIIAVIEAVIAAITGHPGGPAAGCVAVTEALKTVPSK